MDRAEFENIYRKYVDLVHCVANSIIHDYHLAQDICHEVFLKLHQRIENIREDGLKAWLEVVTENTAIDYQRRRKRQADQEETIGKMHQAESSRSILSGILERKNIGWELTDQGLDRQMELREFGHRIFRELQEKNPEWYRIILYLDVGGFSVRETAQQLRISDGNLRVKHCRAKSWLRQNFSSKLREIL